MLVYTLLPFVLGAVVAGCLLGAGLHLPAVVALVVGAAASLSAGVCTGLVALVVALSALYRAVGALWVVVSRMADFLDSDDEGEGGGGGDDMDPPDLIGEVAYDSGQPVAPGWGPVSRRFPPAGPN